MKIKRGPQRCWAAGLILLAAVTIMSAACHHSTAPPPAPRGNDARPSAPVGNRIVANVGFASRQKFLEHYDKHGAEFGSISKEEYLSQAQQLRDRPAGGEVMEATRADGVITRFDRKSGAFLAFNSDLTIRTFFKPNDGENYFRRQSKRSAGSAGRGRDNE